jgi:hypothetical protein
MKEEETTAAPTDDGMTIISTLTLAPNPPQPVGFGRLLTNLAGGILLSLTLLMNVGIGLKMSNEGEDVFAAICRRIVHEQDQHPPDTSIEIESTQLAMTNGKPISPDELCSFVPQLKQKQVSSLPSKRLLIVLGLGLRAHPASDLRLDRGWSILQGRRSCGGKDRARRDQKEQGR